eukprot:TRINITY_DN13015_c0_g5_i3.p1 TRINITY_DN13015_c0_g5~~TRINITY_DN13015_c0_g5_i3.p1  ORF type:complete len:280 (+),score=29.51 TRINITY_DN13015_c0_g5_i3:73-912(+)
MILMKLMNCNNGVTYDVIVVKQGIVFLVFTFIYLIIEAVYIWQTTSLFKRGKSFKGTPTIVAIYVCIHVIFIGDIIYFLGGVILCYNEYLYYLFGQYCSAFGRCLIYLVNYRIELYLQLVLYGNFKQNFIQIFSLSLAIIDNAAFFIIATMVFTCTDTPDTSIILYYDAYSNCFITIVFTYTALRVIKAIKDYPQYFDSSQWKFLIIVIYAHTFFCLLFAIYTRFKQIYFPRDTTVWSALVIAGFNLATDILPGLAVFWFVLYKSGTSTSGNRLIEEFS